MPVAFPLTPAPSWYATVSWPKRSAIHYVGDTVQLTLSQATPTAYVVRDYLGNTVASGSVSSTSVNLGSSFAPGWYRVYFTGPNTDALFGTSYGATNFVVIRADSRFVTNAPQQSPDVGAGQGGGEAKDMILKGVMLRGTSRHQIADASAPTAGVDSIATAQIASALGATYGPNNDSARPLLQFCQFPNRTADRVDVSNGSFCRVYVKDPSIDGSLVFVASASGTSSGAKITISYPNSSTVVETYDNLANGGAAATAMLASNYVRAFSAGNTVSTLAATAIGNAFRNGVIQTVAALYPYGITRFEGPRNEGAMNAELAHVMRLYQDAVHTGNASAVAIGPCPVDIENLAGWRLFLNAGGGSYCDEISFHAYNSQTNGDINLGRYQIEAFQAMLASYGLSAKPLWHTEATHVFTSVYQVHHPRRSRVPLLQTLLFEQYGLPRERNVVWYDRSHGFNSYPAWLGIGDTSLTPYAALYRTLAEETYGMTHHHRIDFGSVPANRIFLGSVYAPPAGTTGATVAVLVCQSYIPSSSVTLTVVGAANGTAIAVVDGFGNTSTQTVASGRITVPVTDTPSYVRVPGGAHVAVYSVNDWGHTPNPSVSQQATTFTLGGTVRREIADDSYLTSYGASSGIAKSTVGLPDDAIVQFGQSVTVDRVLVWCGAAWQTNPGLVDYDIDTWDGATWTTQTTVTKTTPTSFLHGTTSNSTGTQRETFWDEQWIEDVKLPSPVACQGIRVHVRAASYGGEPDQAATTAGGQGMDPPKLAIQEIAILSASTFSAGTGYSGAVLADSPNVYLRLAESSGAAASQVNSPTYDGTYGAGTVRNVGGAIGDGNGAVDVTSDVVTVPNGSLTNLGNGPLTLECWVKPASLTSSSQQIISKGDHGYSIGYVNGGKFTLTTTGHPAIATSSLTMTANAWNHLVVTKNGSAVTMYLNGVSCAVAGTDVTLNNSSGLPITIGTVPGGGQMDEFALYPSVLSAARVLAHYQAGVGPAAPVASTAPAVTGSTVSGEQLQSSRAQWVGTAPTGYSYQWQDSADGLTGWADIAGATRSDFVIPAAAENGKYLRVNVTASNTVGSSVQSSAAVGPVTAPGAGQALETDSAQTVTRIKRATLTQPSETETAQAIDPASSGPGAQIRIVVGHIRIGGSA